MKTIIAAMLLACALISQGQSYQDSFRKADDNLIAFMASYPVDIRHAVLNLSQYPYLLVRINFLQKNASKSFQKMIGSYSQQEQINFYELSRYPELIHELVSQPAQSGINAEVLSRYPQEVRNVANAVFSTRWADLKAMDDLQQSCTSTMGKIIADIPFEVQSDFRKVIYRPEVMSMLIKKLDQVWILGELYKEDPKLITYKVDFLSTLFMAQAQKDLDDYKKQVAEDSQLQEELKKSAEDFAASVSSNEEQLLVNAASPLDKESNSNSLKSYSYWYGYPNWYANAMWYPQAFYYNSGYYVDSKGTLVINSFPSVNFAKWLYYPLSSEYFRKYTLQHKEFISRAITRQELYPADNNITSPQTLLAQIRKKATRHYYNHESAPITNFGYQSIQYRMQGSSPSYGWTGGYYRAICPIQNSTGATVGYYKRW